MHGAKADQELFLMHDAAERQSESLSCARSTRSSRLCRSDSNIPFLFSGNGIRDCGVLAQVALVAKAFRTENTFLIDPVIMGKCVDPIPHLQINPQSVAHLRALPTGKPKRRQGPPDFV